MIKNFLEFIKESQSQGQVQKSETVPTLHLINDIEYEHPDVQWFITVNIKDIWDKYKSKTISFNEFAKLYNEKLLSQQTELKKISERCYNELVEITNQVGEYNEEKSNRYFNKIYDWGDEHGIKIDIGEQQETQQSQQAQESQPPTENNIIQ
jgi:hypothetical protein